MAALTLKIARNKTYPVQLVEIGTILNITLCPPHRREVGPTIKTHLKPISAQACERRQGDWPCPLVNLESRNNRIAAKCNNPCP